jgi:hypothetical protein
MSLSRGDSVEGSRLSMLATRPTTKAAAMKPPPYLMIPDGLRGGGAPHLGQAEASVLTDSPHSLHLTSAISLPFYRVKGTNDCAGGPVLVPLASRTRRSSHQPTLSGLMRWCILAPWRSLCKIATSFRSLSAFGSSRRFGTASRRIPPFPSSFPPGIWQNFNGGARPTSPILPAASPGIRFAPISSLSGRSD